jgi:alkylated DNA repair dioxygenase AlkB
VRTLAWEQRDIVLFGKRVRQPRLIAWSGALPYRYSGQTLEPRASPPALEAVTQRVSKRVGVDFNHVLVNRYRDGRDSMGWHADDEPELGDQPPIATFSLGAPRTFRLKPRRGAAAERLEYELRSGSLLIMSGATQHHYVHSIPKQHGCTEERISLTFRRVLVSPGRG